MKTNPISLSAFLVVLLAISGCSMREEALPPEVITSLRTTFNANDPVTASELFTEDGAMLPDFGPPVKGKAAIKQYMEKTLRAQLQFWISSEHSMVSGDIAYDEGDYRIRDMRRSQDIDSGRYINIFKRVNGSWKIYRSIFKSNFIPGSTSAATASAETGAAPAQ